MNVKGSLPLFLMSVILAFVALNSTSGTRSASGITDRVSVESSGVSSEGSSSESTVGSLPSGDTDGTDRITQSLAFSANGVSTNGASCCGGSVSEEWSYIYDYDGIEEYLYDMEVDEDGNVYVGGATFIEGRRFLLLKLNSAGGREWVRLPEREAPGPGSGPSCACDLAIGPSGSVYATGWFNGGYRGEDGATPQACFTVKYSPAGAEEWRRLLPGERFYYESGAAGCSSIAVDGAGNAYVGGAIGNQPILIKYLANGTEEWVVETSVGAEWIELDDQGNIYIAGSGEVAPEWGRDYYIAKLDPLGAEEWLWVYERGKYYHDDATQFVRDGSGNLYLTGTGQYWRAWNAGAPHMLTVKVSPEGQTIWIDSSDGPFLEGEGGSIAVDEQGQAYVAGVGCDGQFGPCEMLTIKYDANGNQLWAYSNPDLGYALVTLAPTGGVFLASSSGGHIDASKLTAFGQREWTASFYGPPGVQAYASQVALGNGDVYVGGIALGDSPRERDLLVVKFDGQPSIPPPTQEDRKVIFIQGIDSESGECGQSFRNRVDWMVEYLLQDASLTQSVPSLDSADDFFYFSYSGVYCEESPGVADYQRPVYDKESTCNGVFDAAVELDDLINALISRYPGASFDFITHSMGGLVASYWASWESLGKPLVDAGRVNSIVTFDSPLRGLPNKNPATSACDLASQSWRDLHCNDPEQATDPQACESEIVWKIQSVAASVPLYTIDSTQLDIIPINVEFVPRDRTTFISSNSELHCQFDDDHTSVWENDNLGGGDPVSCWEDFSWTDSPPESTDVWGSPSTKGTFVSCAIASVTGADCMERLGDIVIPNASVSSFTPSGSNVIEIAGLSGLFVGDHILINPGMPNEEENQISGFGSLILSSPLVYDHEAGESIVRLSSGTIPSLTPTPTPTASPDVTPTATVGGTTFTPAPTPTPTPTPVPTPVPTAVPGPAKGDVNCDGDVNVVDTLQDLRYVAGLSVNQNAGCPPIGSEFNSIFGDIDCDEDVDAVDALWILRYVAALPSNLPQGCAAIGATEVS